MVPNLKVSNVTTKSFLDVRLTCTLEKNYLKIKILIILVLSILGFDPVKMTSDAFNNIKRKFGWK